ncbi:MAG TPA: hypothetical protein VLV89_00055 [Candidatus Acidoferrum sp.]|nr:hypothetical protein [Candidatus Acidoferrum sp.]
MTTKHPPADPDFIQKTRDTFAQQGLMHHLGARIIALEPSLREIRAALRRVPHTS